jgi:hypothetical protein
MPVPIISVIVTLVVIGVILWLLTTYIPMAPPVKTVIQVVVVLLLCLWLLSVFGITNYTYVPVRR